MEKIIINHETIIAESNKVIESAITMADALSTSIKMDSSTGIYRFDGGDNMARYIDIEPGISFSEPVNRDGLFMPSKRVGE